MVNNSMKFNVTIKSGINVVTVLEGRKLLDTKHVTLADAEKVLELEALFEKFTGYRMHVDSVYVETPPSVVLAPTVEPKGKVAKRADAGKKLHWTQRPENKKKLLTVRRRGAKTRMASEDAHG